MRFLLVITIFSMAFSVCLGIEKVNPISTTREWQDMALSQCPACDIRTKLKDHARHPAVNLADKTYLCQIYSAKKGLNGDDEAPLSGKKTAKFAIGFPKQALGNRLEFGVQYDFDGALSGFSGRKRVERVCQGGYPIEYCPPHVLSAYQVQDVYKLPLGVEKSPNCQAVLSVYHFLYATRDTKKVYIEGVVRTSCEELSQLYYFVTIPLTVSWAHTVELGACDLHPITVD